MADQITGDQDAGISWAAGDQNCLEGGVGGGGTSGCCCSVKRRVERSARKRESKGCPHETRETGMYMYG